MKVLNVTVVPGSKRDEVVVLEDNAFEVHTVAGAKEGRANKQTVKLLSSHLNVSPSKLLVSSGEQWNEKTILLMD